MQKGSKWERLANGMGGAIAISSSSATGKIDRVSDWGSIAGTFSAGDEIDQVRAGGAVTATLMAATVASPIQNDSTLTTGDLPTFPDTEHSDILSRGTDLPNCSLRPTGPVVRP